MILLGRSLGAGPSVQLAALLGRRVGGLIVVAAPASILRVAMWSARTRCGDMFASIDCIEEVAVPTLVVHGTRDRIVRPRHGVELVARSRFAARPLWVQGGGHNDLETGFEDILHERYEMMLREVREWQEEMAELDSEADKKKRRRTERCDGRMMQAVRLLDDVEQRKGVDERSPGQVWREIWARTVRKAVLVCTRSICWVLRR